MMKRNFPYTLILLVALTGCLRQIPYEPALLEKFRERPGNIQLEFTTANGRQVAFYIPPAQEPERPPAQIAILYPGIKSVALGWLRFIKPEDCRETGYLLIDYPGQGLSEGSMHPKESYLSSEGALQALAEHFEVNKLEAEYHLMGHSFGTGAALQFAGRHQVKRIVLIAPFTTLRNAVAEKFFLLSVLLPAQMDNRAIIRQLLLREQPPQITIMHGGKDALLPVDMGRELAALDPTRITYLEFPADDHVSILTTCRDLIFRILAGGADHLEMSRR
ncbi:MAG: alpha/beta hydrolase [Desulfurivibrionaceae bacterium]